MSGDFSAFKGRRVLVTGDTGFKGSWLCLWLADLGAEVHGYALPPERPQDLFHALGLAKLIRHRDGDVRDAAALAAAAAEARPEFIFHLAAQPLVRRSYREPKETFDVNVGGSVNLLEAARACKDLRALVYVTSDKCYKVQPSHPAYVETDPLGGHDPYSASKAAAEVVFASYNASFFGSGPGAASARAGNVIGGGDWSEDRLVPDVIRALRGGAPLVLRSPQHTRPWQHVLEPLSGYLRLAARLAERPREFSGAWNFGPDERDNRSVLDVARLALSLWGSGEERIVVRPESLVETPVLRLDSAKARRELGWSPRWAFERAVEETVRWYAAAHRGASALELCRAQLKEYAAVRA